MPHRIEIKAGPEIHCEWPWAWIVFPGGRPARVHEAEARDLYRQLGELLGSDHLLAIEEVRALRWAINRALDSVDGEEEQEDRCNTAHAIVDRLAAERRPAPGLEQKLRRWAEQAVEAHSAAAAVDDRPGAVSRGILAAVDEVSQMLDEEPELPASPEAMTPEQIASTVSAARDLCVALSTNPAAADHLGLYPATLPGPLRQIARWALEFQPPAMEPPDVTEQAAAAGGPWPPPDSAKECLATCEEGILGVWYPMVKEGDGERGIGWVWQAVDGAESFAGDYVPDRWRPMPGSDQTPEPTSRCTACRTEVPAGHDRCVDCDPGVGEQPQMEPLPRSVEQELRAWAAEAERENSSTGPWWQRGYLIAVDDVLAILDHAAGARQRRDVEAAAARLPDPDTNPEEKPAVNPEMDAHAAGEGLGHWRCISLDSNMEWQRVDGHRVSYTGRGTYMDDLRAADKARPMEGGPLPGATTKRPGFDDGGRPDTSDGLCDAIVITLWGFGFDSEDLHGIASVVAPGVRRWLKSRPGAQPSLAERVARLETRAKVAGRSLGELARWRVAVDVSHATLGGQIDRLIAACAELVAALRMRAAG
jgi:hypothetical protein